MNENEKNFLRDFAILLEKYNIDDVRVVEEGVQFASWGEIFTLKGYCGSDNVGEHGTFYGMMHKTPKYTIRDRPEVTYNADET